MKTNDNIKKISLAAVFCAVIFVACAFFPKIPMANGYVHFGDVFIFLCAALLPKKYSAASAAVGASLADLVSGYVIWLPATFIIKALSVLFFSVSDRIVTKRNIIACIPAFFTGVCGYYLYETLICKSFIVPLTSLPFNALQEGFGIVLFVIFGTVLDKTVHVKGK